MGKPVDEARMAKMPARRFTLSWSVEEQPACFVVRDHSGQKLAYIYFEDEPGAEIAGEIAHARRGAADRGQCGEAAGAIAAVQFPNWAVLRRATQ
jgi:hypothetical protein